MTSETNEAREPIVILNVDDYEAGRYATSRVLRQAGFEVMEASTGMEALARAESRPDLIVLDVNLPDVDGFEVCRRLKEAPGTAAIPVLYLSAAYRSPEHRVQGLDLGADGYLTQPVDGRELVATVNALLRARHVRDAVRESEERFRTLMTATSDIIWTTAPDGRVDGDQQDWAEFTGQRPEEFQGAGWLAAVHPDDRDRVARAWSDAVRERALYETDFRLRRADGEYRLMRVRGIPVGEVDGTVREWVGAASDITERRNAEESLARHAVQLRELASASLEISAARSLDGTLQAITERARAIIGAREAVTSLAPESGGSAPTSAVSREGPEAARATPGRPTLAVPLLARDGAHLGTIRLSGRERGAFTERDEAILVQLAQVASVAIENIRLLEETQRANRAKSDFLATMSHELRTPLNAMIGYTDLLMLGVPVPVPPGALEHVERIRGAALHLTQLIEEVLTHARIEAGRDELHLELVDLPDLLSEVAGFVEPLARPKGLRFMVDSADAPPVVRTDAQKLRQILLNLLGNAVKFTERGEVALVTRRDGDHLVLEVRDTGIGIPEAFLEKIFEAFWQVDGTKTRRAGGTGLGLGVVRQLAQRLGGEVRVASRVGEGSVFTVRLPIAGGE